MVNRKEIVGLLKIMRPLNLGIAALAMVAMRYGLNARLLDDGLTASVWIFAESMGVMVLLMAAGNLINDYFDIKEDRINHPERQVIGHSVPRRDLIKAHAALSIVGMALAIELSVRIGDWTVAALAALIGALLWWYSSALKGTFVWGNLLVALLTGLVPLWATLPELHAASATEKVELLWWAAAFGCIAFSVSWVREIIKDIQDIPGDQAAGHRTLAVEWGTNRSSKAALRAQIILTLAYAAAAATWSVLFTESASFQSHICLMIPGLLMAITTLFLKSPAHFQWADRTAKLTLVAGFAIAFVLPI